VVARSRAFGEIGCDNCRRSDGIVEEPLSCPLVIYDMKDYVDLCMVHVRI